MSARKRLTTFLCTALLCLTLPSCATHSTNTSQISSENPEQFEIYIARGSLFSPAEFEQFKFFSNKLFIECGIIRAGRQAAKSRLIAALSPEQISELIDSSKKAYQANKGKESLLDDPGSEFGFADPGQVLFTIRFPSHVASPSAEREYSIKTSLDSVSDGDSSTTKVLQNLTKTVRAIALSLPEVKEKGNLCGNRSFYGL